MTKQCTICKMTKPVVSYYSDKQKKDRLSSHCKDCGKERALRYRIIHPEKVQKANIKSKFGLAHSEYRDLVTRQNNLCAICSKAETAMYRGRVRNLAIDHNRITTEVRGLLCMFCNLALGHLKEDPVIMASMIEYVQKHN